MGNVIKYLVCDTETATLPFADQLSRGNSELKKKIAIAKPLVYDIGWQIVDKRGNVYKTAQYLVAETFGVPSVFNTAYYKEKRPIYVDMMERGEIEVKTWNDIMKEFIPDMRESNYLGAFNSMFDFKKAIPFTELYIKKLYGAGYYEWEQKQMKQCEAIVNDRKKEGDSNFDGDTFFFRGETHAIFDIWGLACERLINKKKYKELCLKLGMISQSGDYFKTSAESSFRYLRKDHAFEEAHTALADVKIECFLLQKALHNNGIKQGITFFPFKILGTTTDFLIASDKVKEEQVNVVLDLMEKRLGYFEQTNKDRCAYAVGLRQRHMQLQFLLKGNSGAEEEVASVKKAKKEKQINNKQIVFDMDGTLVDFYSVDNWEPRLRAEDHTPYLEAKPLWDMVELRAIIKELKEAGWRFAINTWLSKEASKEYKKRIRAAKVETLRRHFESEALFDEIHMIQYGRNKAGAMRNRGGILIDDNPEMREQWLSSGGARTVDPTIEDLIEFLKGLMKGE